MKIIISESQYKILLESDRYLNWIKRRWDDIFDEYYKILDTPFLSPKKFKDEEQYVKTFFAVLMDALYPKMLKYFDEDKFYDEIQNYLKNIFEKKVRKKFKNS